MDRFHSSGVCAFLRLIGFAVVASVASLSSLHADVVISSAPTANMTCSGGVCAPTANDAVLSVSDLENLLASGNVTVTTTGSGVQALNILVKAPFSWSSQNSLTFDADQSITIDRTIAVTGAGGAALNGELSFGQKGHLQFANISSPLAINGTAYTLVNNIASLASAIASNPSGVYALADDYDAAADGTYTASPIQTVFTGTFDGLGNTISHLSINHKSGQQTYIGLFYFVLGGVVEHLRLAHVLIVGAKRGFSDDIGALAGGGNGVGAYFFQDSATGTIRLHGRKGVAGGLIGLFGTEDRVDTCFADVNIDAVKAGGHGVGGLVGGSSGTITDSFASGSVAAGNSGKAGGLVGLSSGAIENSYATGAVTGGARAKVGGIVGVAGKSDIEFSYSTGAVSGGTSSVVGGFAGANIKVRTVSDNYWDTTTSGTTQGVGKGSTKNVTGLTTRQLQSRLPHGFDRSVWGEKKSINNGLPYLLANPPPK
jgi:hypothetical protein